MRLIVSCGIAQIVVQEQFVEEERHEENFFVHGTLRFLKISKEICNPSTVELEIFVISLMALLKICGEIIRVIYEK